jgi:alkylation response protein AidB-like acyl-CoA dehydrogenase
MDFELSPDQKALVDACRNFATREILPRWREADELSAFPRELLIRAAENGLLGLAIPLEHGGSGLGILEDAILAEETARANTNLAAALMLEGALLPGLLSKFGSDEMVQSRIPEVLAGKSILALGVTEPNAGSDVSAIATTARKRGNDWVLNGEKCFITLGGEADGILVLARVDEPGVEGPMALFLVDSPVEGLVVKKMDMIASRPIPTAQLFFNDLRVPNSSRLNAGFREVLNVFNKERIIVASRWVGHCVAMFDWALDYAKSREQFNKRIGDFQSLAFEFADRQMEIEAARLLVRRAAWGWDSGQSKSDVASASSYAKLAATKAAKSMSDFALHVGGGWALVNNELPIARMVIDSWVAPVAGGSFEIQRRIIARQLGLKPE